MKLRLRSLLLGSLLAASCSAFAADNPAGFTDYLDKIRTQAEQKGISSQTLDQALSHVTYLHRSVKADRNQPERRLTLDSYLPRAVPDWKIKKARKLYVEHQALLKKIGKKYGVQPRFIVALWGIETNFGAYTGNTEVINALATMAYEGRREAFFRKELLNALQIIDDGNVDFEHMIGSWAGAMGQTQFMPSSYLAFAVDENNDGRKDIWTTLPDVFGSIANYLAKSGWDDSMTWGRQVKIPAGFDMSLTGLDTTKPMAQWQALGVRRYDGSALPGRQLQASLIAPDSADGRVYLVYDNYKVLMKWNRSLYFGCAVGYLSNRIIYPAL